MMDLGLFDPQGELVGWAELDSCVSCYFRIRGNMIDKLLLSGNSLAGRPRI
jgi:hypothetical protein